MRLGAEVRIWVLAARLGWALCTGRPSQRIADRLLSELRALE